MTGISIGRVAALAAGALLSCAAWAQSTPFFGALLNDTPPSLPGSPCTTGQVNISLSPAAGITQGLSNFGSFVFTQQHCITLPPTEYSGGTFSFDFAAGDRLFGTYAGVIQPTATPGLMSNTIVYTVTGGSGRFADATGQINGVGTLDLRVQRPINAFQLDGTLQVSPVPEPAAAAMWLAGLGTLGWVARRRR